MPVLLDIEPTKVLAIAGTIAGALAGIGKLLSWIADLRRQLKSYRIADEAAEAAAARAAPFGVAPAPDRADIELRLRVAELDAARSRAVARCADGRNRELMLERENAELRKALKSERGAHEMTAITCDHLRRRNEALEFQLGDALVQPDEAPDEGDRTTPVLPKPK